MVLTPILYLFADTVEHARIMYYVQRVPYGAHWSGLAAKALLHGAGLHEVAKRTASDAGAFWLF